jgi:hypothetical protein
MGKLDALVLNQVAPHLFASDRMAASAAGKPRQQDRAADHPRGGYPWVPGLQRRLNRVEHLELNDRRDLNYNPFLARGVRNFLLSDPSEWHCRASPRPAASSASHRGRQMSAVAAPAQAQPPAL